jgi:hypothetical protein
VSGLADLLIEFFNTPFLSRSSKEIFVEPAVGLSPIKSKSIVNTVETTINKVTLIVILVNRFNFLKIKKLAIEPIKKIV